MPLPWIRLDTNLPSHDKVLALLTAYPRDGRATAFVYVCSLAYAGHNGTDGVVPFAALPLIHGTKKDAGRLVEDFGAGRLWVPDARGWAVPHWGERQQTTFTTRTKRAAAQLASRKANCVRWHAPGCECWKADS